MQHAKMHAAATRVLPERVWDVPSHQQPQLREGRSDGTRPRAPFDELMSAALLDFDWKLLSVVASSDSADIAKPLLRLQLFVGACSWRARDRLSAVSP